MGIESPRRSLATVSATRPVVVLNRSDVGWKRLLEKAGPPSSSPRRAEKLIFPSEIEMPGRSKVEMDSATAGGPARAPSQAAAARSAKVNFLPDLSIFNTPFWQLDSV